MKSQKINPEKSHISKYEDLDRKTGKIPVNKKRIKSTPIQDELADDFGEVLGESFHGFDDDYYYDEDDNY